jgi:diguanylate cyclase (GGDEF)-like protein
MGVGVVFSARPVFAAILCLCLFLGATAILPAGASDTANLPALLKKLDTLPEAEKIPVLNLIAETYLARKDTREALRWAEQALRLALVRGNDWEIVRARLTLGSAYYFLENYALSLEHLKECSTKLKELEGAPGGVPRDKLLKARIETAGWLGYAFEKNQDIQSSLDALQTGVDLAKEAGDERSTADFLYRIAAGRFVKTEYEKALAAGIEAVETARKLRDPGLLSDCESAVGFIYRDLKRWDTALEFFQSALRSSEAAHDERRTALALNEIGSVYLEQGDKAAALIFLRQALDIDIKEGQEREIAIVSQNIAEIYMSLNRIGEAQAVLERALPYIERVNFPKERAAIYGLLADVHERRGEPGLALAYLRKASDLEERVPKEEGSRQLQELQTRYETDKKRRENETLAQKNNFNELTLKKQTAIRYSLIALSLLVILIAALIYNRYRLKARANWELKLANAEISAKKDELDRANVRLEELSRHDPLTGLSNRRDMMEKFEEEKIRFDRTGRPFALIMADIDSFKDINDGHGHDCGDFVLKRLAGVLRSSLRKLTWISRWGGDEFLLLLPETNLAGARRVTDKIRDRMARTPFSWDGQALDVRLSLGVSVFREGTEIDDLLREADQDMYRKKKAAKARPIGLQA